MAFWLRGWMVEDRQVGEVHIQIEINYYQEDYAYRHNTNEQANQSLSS